MGVRELDVVFFCYVGRDFTVPPTGYPEETFIIKLDHVQVTELGVETTS